MDRRLFLQFPLLTSSLAGMAQSETSQRPKKGFKVASGKDRFGEEINFLGNRIQCKVSAKDTEGDLCIFHNIIVTEPYRKSSNSIKQEVN